MLLDPRHMTVTEWTQRMTPQLFAFGNVPVLRAEGQWREWADAINTLPTIAKIVPPSPHAFRHWSDWAAAFIHAASGVLNV